MKLSILIPGIWDTVFNILFSFTDIEYLGNLIMGIFVSYKGYLPVYFKGYGIFGTPYTSRTSACVCRKSENCKLLVLQDKYNIEILLSPVNNDEHLFRNFYFYVSPHYAANPL